jgi:serine phosphatase RsbU (regulator of sigma subunit)
MARMLAEARYHLAREPSPREAVNRMARGFGKLGWDDRFVTMVLMVLDCKTHEVTIVNAGHMAPILRRPDGKVEEAAEEITGVPLGVDPEWEYSEQSFQLEPGASLTAFTDGFSEATNADNNLYGMERLQAQVAAPAKTAKEMGERILADVEKFVDGYKQSDDMCLLCFGRTGGEKKRA